MRGLMRISMMLGVMAGAASISACNPMRITDVDLRTVEEQGVPLAEFEVDFEVGNMQMPAVSLPIVNPDDPDELWGRFAIMPGNNNQGGTVIAAVSIEAVSNGYVGGECRLPNGSQIPVGLPEGVGMICAPIQDTGVSVYLSLDLDAGVALLGTTVAIKEFDDIGRYAPGGMLFIPFDIEGVKGTGGIFAGKKTKQSGLGFFVDFGGLIPELDLDGQKSGKAMASSDAVRNFESRVKFKSVQSSKSKREKMERELYKLDRDRKKLHLY